MSILVCGSLAFDTIMVFGDRFRNHILAEQIHILNVSFLVPDMRREFGGCAGNIAYNLALLGEDALIMATVGDDAGPYRERLAALGLSSEHVRTVPGSYTAQAFITTDLDDNQITAFHPGAMSFSHHNHIESARGLRLGIVAPDGREGMLSHCRQFAAADVPFIFDPGQGLPMFSGEELMDCVRLARYCTVNDYEARMLVERTGLELPQIAAHLEALVVTRGGEGSQIFTAGECIDVPCVKAHEVVDPTGCGDAYRAGLLYGIANGMGIERAGRLASVMGSIKIGHRGGQNHAPSREEIAARYAAAFGEQPWQT